MAWKYNQVGVTYNEHLVPYNGITEIVKKYYTGFMHTTKALLRRGLGF